MTTTHARQRLSKHQLREDLFSTAIFSAREWAQENLRLTLIVAGGVIVVIALILGVRSYIGSRAESAAVLYGEAGVELRGGNLATAIVSLRKVMDDYPGSSVAGLACVQLADSYFRQRSFEEAKSYFQRYLDDYNKDPLLIAASWAGLAAINEQASANGEGAKQYRKAAQVNPKTFQATENLHSALRCAIAAKDSALASDVFNELQKDLPPNDQAARTGRQLMIERGYLPPKAP